MTWRGGRPRAACRIAAATASAVISIARPEVPARCGDRITLGRPAAGRPPAPAPRANTSSPAPPSRPPVSASISAAWSTTRPARRVDQERPGLHALELGPPDEAARPRAERHVERDRVRPLQECVQPRARLDVETAQAVRLRRRRVAAHPHAEPRAGDPGGGAPDPPAAHDPERPAAELGEPERVPGVERPRADRAVGGQRLLGEREEERDRVLGDRPRVGDRRVADDDAASPRRAPRPRGRVRLRGPRSAGAGARRRSRPRSGRRCG